MEWSIGNIKIKNKILTAPMAGLTDHAFRLLAEEYGAGLVYTEMISAEAIVRDNKKTFEMLNGIDVLDIPIGVQLFGGEPETLAKAAKIISERYTRKLFIDLNMGCPVPKVAVSAKAGSSLMKDPNRVRKIVTQVVGAVTVPVTVKIRSGWDSNNINAVEIAKICEESGASAITVHGRTRSQGYSGKADWNIIKQVKNSVSIPVIGNGDVLSCYDAKRMLVETGCDAIMIARGTLGNPWLIRECVDYLSNGKEPTLVTDKEKMDMIRKHLDYLLMYKHPKVAILEMRTHGAWYFKGMPRSKEIKQAIFKVNTQEEFLSLLDEYEEGIV